MIGDDKLKQFIGAWAGEERLLPTAWTSAGVAEGTFVIAEAPHRGVFIDYTEIRDGVTALCAHGVLVDEGWWWFDSLGFVPLEPGSASWHGDCLELERRSERGRTITRLRIEDGTLFQEVQTAVHARGELAPMLVGQYKRR
jgi:hypothetical protein